MLFFFVISTYIGIKEFMLNQMFPFVPCCSTSMESRDGEVSVLVRASHSPDNAVSAPDELQLQSDHRDETPDSVQPFLTAEEA